MIKPQITQHALRTVLVHAQPLNMISVFSNPCSLAYFTLTFDHHCMNLKPLFSFFFFIKIRKTTTATTTRGGSSACPGDDPLASPSRGSDASDVVVSPGGGDDFRESPFLEPVFSSSTGCGDESGRGVGFERGEDWGGGRGGVAGDGRARASIERGQTSFFRVVRKNKNNGRKVYLSPGHLVDG